MIHHSFGCEDEGDGFEVELLSSSCTLLRQSIFQLLVTALRFAPPAGGTLAARCDWWLRSLEEVCDVLTFTLPQMT